MSSGALNVEWSSTRGPISISFDRLMVMVKSCKSVVPGIPMAWSVGLYDVSVQ